MILLLMLACTKRPDHPRTISPTETYVKAAAPDGNLFVQLIVELTRGGECKSYDYIPTLYGGDQMVFRMSGDESGHLRIVNHNADGDCVPVFPQEGENDWLSGVSGEFVLVPQRSPYLAVYEASGSEQLYFLVTHKRQDASADQTLCAQQRLQRIMPANHTSTRTPDTSPEDLWLDFGSRRERVYPIVTVEHRSGPLEPLPAGSPCRSEPTR